MNDPILVTGATGPHGNAVAHALLSAGRDVRALTRDAASAKAQALAVAGARLAVGDLLEAESLSSAMDGIGAVYAVTTPFGGNGPELEVEQGRQLITAALAAEVPWFIFASVGDANVATGVPHFESKGQIERLLADTALAHTTVAPTYFYENVGDVPAIADAGELVMALPADQPLQQVSLADLGSVVVAILGRRDEFLGARVDVAGDHPTPTQMAAALQMATGKPVNFRQRPISEVAERNHDLGAMYRFLSERGYSADSDAVRARFPEVSFQSFADWLAR